MWYYHQGLKGFFRVWKNYLWHGLDFFSMRDLLFSLFSPWRRDITPKTWRGWNPLLSIRRLIENIFSRFMGALVRISVLILGLVWEFVVFAVGLIFLFLWIGSPAFLLLGIPLGFFYEDFFLLFLATFFVVLFSFFCFFQSKKTLYAGMDLIDLYRFPVFSRILARVDINPSEIRKEDLLSKQTLISFLDTKNVRWENFVKALEWETALADERIRRSKFWTKEQLFRMQPIGRQWKFGYTPQLDDVSEDVILSLSTTFPSMRVCAHKRDLEVMTLILSRHDQDNVLLVGRPGSGRKTIVNWFAKYVHERVLGGFFQDARILRLNMEHAFSVGAENGLTLAYIEHIFAQAAFAGNIILVIDNLENFIGEGASRSGNPDITSILEKFLPFGNFRLIATVTEEGFHSFLERNSAITKHMERIDVKEVSEEDAIDILLDEFMELEEKNVVFTVKAIRYIVEQSGRFNASVPLPERALDLAQEVLMYRSNHPKGGLIDSHAVNEYITLKTGIPIGVITTKEREKLIDLEALMAQRIIGQRHAVSQLAKALRKARSGVDGSLRPVGSFLFLGPTGVGKTEMAKVLASTYFGGDARMARLDMSEFQTPSSVVDLIGSRETNMTGRLASLVRDNPYGVLLLDELEKTDRGVLDIFLQILDEGFFTDAFGSKVRFNNLIIIATSNAGSAIIRDYFERNPGGDTSRIEKEVTDFIVNDGLFRVEFLNRFDGVIFFFPLSHEELIQVTQILLKEFSESVWKNKRIRVSFDPDIAERVVEFGYNASFGARSVRRYIADTVEAYVVDAIIAQGLREGEGLSVSAEDMQSTLS